MQTMTTSIEAQEGHVRSKDDKVSASNGMSNPSSPKKHKVFKRKLLMRNTTHTKENLHEFWASRNMRDPIGMMTTTKPTRRIFIAKPGVSAPVITNNAKM